VVVGHGPVQGETFVWVAEGCELWVCGQERFDSRYWEISAEWLEVCDMARTLALATSFVYRVFCFVVLHDGVWLDRRVPGGPLEMASVEADPTTEARL
jgi:hypothetical protein